MYCNSYMTKMENSMASTFNKIHENCMCDRDNKIQTIHKLGNVMLNTQQMLTRQAFHIVPSFPLYSSSRKTIFINTAQLKNKHKC